MQPRYAVGLLLLASSLTAAGQAACSATAMHSAARNVEDIRRTLHQAAVPTNDPAIPAPIARHLLALQSALAQAAEAAFACAPTSAADADLQKTLAEALNANRASAAETTEELPGNKDKGAYGSDLAVQIFQLSTRPKIFEVTFRYGIECGDDNLLLIFQAPSDTSGAWHETLRWGAQNYNEVSDALGDFIMLTPLTGDYKHPTWRYIVAHGHPACDARPHPSTFSLDLLTPTADPAKPTVSWHFDHPYTEGAVTPRLATTEDTIEFRLVPTPPDPQSKATKPKSTHTTTSTPATPEIYRFHLDPTGNIVPTQAP